jgi:hypothetical protein
MSFDDDDDIRRQESDELHGIAGGWFDKDPTPAHGIERPSLSELGSQLRDQGVLS